MKKKSKATKLYFHIKHMEWMMRWSKDRAKNKIKKSNTYYFRKQIEVAKRMLNK
jgi:hypothetical protein